MSPIPSLPAVLAGIHGEVFKGTTARKSSSYKHGVRVTLPPGFAFVQWADDAGSQSTWVKPNLTHEQAIALAPAMVGACCATVAAIALGQPRPDLLGLPHGETLSWMPRIVCQIESTTIPQES